ncbi:MAG: hypothetical protein ABSC48_01020 [Terracidiphilus sp.]|jgi:hypothetical protein
MEDTRAQLSVYNQEVISHLHKDDWEAALADIGPWRWKLLDEL